MLICIKIISNEIITTSKSGFIYNYIEKLEKLASISKDYDIKKSANNCICLMNYINENSSIDFSKISEQIEGKFLIYVNNFTKRKKQQ